MPDQVKGEINTSADADAAKQSPAPPLPPAVEVPNNGEGGNDKPQCRYIEKPKKNKSNVRKNIEVGCAVALVLITSFYTYYARKQAHSSETAANAARDAVKVASNTLGETQRSNIRQEKLADDNRASSEAESEKAIRATQDAMRLDQRAWVAAASISGVPELDKPFIIRVTAKNTGKTFAKQFKMAVVVSRVVTPNKIPNFGAELENADHQSVSLLPPNGEYTSTNPITGDPSAPFPKNPTQDDLDRMKAGGIQFFVFGRMEYSDIFHKAHWSTFCFDLTQQAAWELCSEHNDADDN
jgi:hypothetical protein